MKKAVNVKKGSDGTRAHIRYINVPDGEAADVSGADHAGRDPMNPMPYHEAALSLLVSHGGVVTKNSPPLPVGVSPSEALMMDDEQLLELDWAHEKTYDVEPEDAVDFYYGVKADRTATYEALQDIMESGIDWEGTTDPAEHVGSIFTDTYNEPERISALIGKVKSGSGRTYTFATEVNDEHGGFGKVMRGLADAPTLDVAFGRLKERLRDRDSFDMSCNF